MYPAFPKFARLLQRGQYDLLMNTPFQLNFRIGFSFLVNSVTATDRRNFQEFELFFHLRGKYSSHNYERMNSVVCGDCAFLLHCHF